VTSPAEMKDLVDTVDPDGEGFVEYEAFVAVAAIKLQSRGEEEIMEEVEKAWRLFVKGGDGGGEQRITMQTLRRVARELKEDVDEQVLRDMIAEANGGLGVREGVRLMEFEGVMRRAGVFR
jgi:Ca2+-binding EF-hand superfamily protein